MGLADDMADLLVTGGLAATVQVGDLQARPDAAVVIVPTPGLPTMRSFGGAVVESLRVQTRSRGTTYPSAEALASAAHGFLDGTKERVINGRRYYWIEAIQPPFYLGLDEEARTLFAENFTVYRAAST